jgi:hypothetical protein
MKILPANLPQDYIRLVERLVKKHSLCPGLNRPERIRIAVRELIRKEFLSSKIREEGAESEQTNKI